MRRPLRKRKCKHCQTFFDPDPRSATRQRHCSKPACRQASKATSQHRWLQKPGNHDYFTGPTQVERVRQWRKAHPGYWRRQRARAPHALQEDLTPQETQKQLLDEGLTPHALQEVFFLQPAVVVGLIAHLTGLTLQEDIATTARRLQQLGRDILCGFPHHQGGIQDGQTPHFAGQTPTRSPSVQLGGPAVVRKNTVASPPSHDENHRAASRHDGARPESCCALKDERSTGEDPIGEAGTAPAPGVSQR